MTMVGEYFAINEDGIVIQLKKLNPCGDYDEFCENALKFQTEFNMIVEYCGNEKALRLLKEGEEVDDND